MIVCIDTKVFMRFILLVLPLIVLLSSCLVTKVVTTPLRIAGDVVSYVPVVGPVVDGVAKGSADAIDLIPL